MYNFGLECFSCDQADGLNAELRIGIPGDHRGILNDDRLFRLLKHFLRVGDPDPLYDPVCDFVLIPRPTLEVELHGRPSIDGVEECEAWQLIDSDDGHTDTHSKGSEERCVTTSTAGIYMWMSDRNSELITDCSGSCVMLSFSCYCCRIDYQHVFVAGAGPGAQSALQVRHSRASWSWRRTRWR